MSQERSGASTGAEHTAGESAVEKVSIALARAHDLQVRYNAFAAIDDAHALAAAKDVRVNAPLAGVPVSVKDILDVAGLPTRWGSPLFSEAAAAPSDIAAVARLREAGAVVIGKTTTTEFAHSPLNSSPLTGITRNPWAPDLTPGGSSAGAGVSVATGVTPIALTTDAGCSTRLPAGCTGTFGLKPTLGLIPHDRVPDAFGTFIHLGLIAGRVANLSRALSVMAGPHEADPISLRAPRLSAKEPSGLKNKRVLIWMKVGNRRVANEVRSATRVAADILTRLGAHVIESAYTLSNPDPIWKVLQQSNWAARFSTASEADRMQLSPTLRAGLDEAFGYSGVDLLKAQVRRTELFRAVQKILTEVDFILTPCVSAPPVSAEYDLAEPLIVDGETVGDLRSEWTTYLSLFDLTGHPALAIPVGFASNGGPLGVQLVTRWYAEAELLAAATEFENEHPPAIWRDTVH